LREARWCALPIPERLHQPQHRKLNQRARYRQRKPSPQQRDPVLRQGTQVQKFYGRKRVAGGCIISLLKEEELPMSEDALRGWYWAGVAVFALVIFVIWYMEVVR